MSQFSYELDERQIRIMLQNAELDYNEMLWQQFENLALEPVRMIGARPQFNLGLSRQIIVPVFFVVIICGLSAILFSFVDFKKKQPASTETAVKTAAPAMVENEDKRETMPTQKSAPAETIVKKDTVNLAVKKEAALPMAQAVKIPDAKPLVATEEIKKETPAVTTVAKKEVPVKRKRRRHSNETFEDLPAINTSISNLGDNAKEPEPEIRMD